MTQWFYARGGQQNGPVTFEQLVALARTGRLDAFMDSVWNESMVNWTPAGQVPGIFNTASGSAIPPMNSSNPYAAPGSDWSSALPSAAVALKEIVPGSEQIDPMVCLSRGFEIAKRQYANIILVGLVYLVCLFGQSFLFGVIQAVIGLVFPYGDQGSTGASVAVIVISILFQVVTQVFSLFLQLGLIRVGLNLVSGKEVSLGMLFGGGPKILRALGATILFGLAVLIGFILLIVPGIYIALRYGQFMNAIVDRDLGVFEAFVYSESITTNNRMNLFLLGVLSILAFFVGMIPCGLGLFVVAPVVWLAGLIAYRWMQYGPDAVNDYPDTQNPMLNAV
jgi:hypothetical protein